MNINLIKLSIDILSSIVEIILIYYFFDRVLTLKDVTKTKIVIFSSIFIAVQTLISTFLLDKMYVPVLFYLVFLCYTFLYKENLAKKVLASVIIFAFMMVSEILVGVVTMFINKSSLSDIQQSDFYYLQGAILSKIIVFSIIRIIGVFKINSKLDISIKTVFSLCVIPITSTICIYYMATTSYDKTNSTYPAMMIIITALIAISIIVNFNLFEKQIKLQKSEDLLINLEKQYKLQSEYYTELKKNLLLTNKNTHDIKNFIIGISTYIDHDKNDIAKKKIEEFYGKIPNVDSMNTGNYAINALMQSKMKIIEQCAFQKEVSILLPDNLHIDEIDLCIFIGNAIDNAIEACQKVENEEERFIEIKIFPYGNQLSMLFKNSKVNDKNEMFHTTKSDSALHGFGIENMKSICAKYDGNIVFDHSENSFAVSALIPNGPIGQV